MSKMSFRRLQNAIDDIVKTFQSDKDIFLKTATLADITEDASVKILAEGDKTVLIFTDGSFITVKDCDGLCEDAVCVVIHCKDYNRSPFTNQGNVSQFIL